MGSGRRRSDRPRAIVSGGEQFPVPFGDDFDVAVHHFDRANDLRAEIINARLWAGLHYRGSSVAGVDLGRSVAKYDLKHAFGPTP